MRIIGYTSEWHAAAFCNKCASNRWSDKELLQGYTDILNSFDAYGYPNNARGYNLHPIFSTDESPDDNTTCDDCKEVIIFCTSMEVDGHRFSYPKPSN